jgi:hypothetical protein
VTTLDGFQTPTKYEHGKIMHMMSLPENQASLDTHVEDFVLQMVHIVLKNDKTNGHS